MNRVRSVTGITVILYFITAISVYCHKELTIPSPLLIEQKLS
jgi:hypothetical protein